MAASITAHTMDLRFGVAKKLCINFLKGLVIVPIFIGRLTPNQTVSTPQLQSIYSEGRKDFMLGALRSYLLNLPLFPILILVQILLDQ